MTEFSRNPPPAWRCILVGCLFAMLCGLAGEIVGVFFGDFWICTVAGTVTGFFFGYVFEAWPFSYRSGEQEDEQRRGHENTLR